MTQCEGCDDPVHEADAFYIDPHIGPLCSQCALVADEVATILIFETHAAAAHVDAVTAIVREFAR